MSEHGHIGGEHGAEHGGNKKIGLMISVLALCLAVSEILGQKAQTHSLQTNIEASNLWSFFQAKTIRKTLVETAADEMETRLGTVNDPALKKTMEERIAKWRQRAAVYESEPGKDGHGGEGRKELTARALHAEKLRDKETKKHGRFELSSGAFQIAIVLASAGVITGFAALIWGAGGLGVLGLLFLISGIVG